MRMCDACVHRKLNVILCRAKAKGPERSVILLCFVGAWQGTLVAPGKREHVADPDAGMAADPACKLLRPLVGLVPTGSHL